MRSIACSSRHLLLKLLLITALSSSLLLPLLPLLPLLILFSSASLSGFHLACTSTFVGAISLRFHPVSFPCSGLLSSQRLIHSTWRYFAGGGTNLVYVVTASTCYTSRFRFTALSSSSSSSSSPSFLFCFSRRRPPRVHIKLPWGHLSMAGGLAEGKPK